MADAIFWCEETLYENEIDFPTEMYYQNLKKASCCNIPRVVYTVWPGDLAGLITNYQYI